MISTTNEITFNELSASDILNEYGYIDISGYTTYTEDEEVCFKLAVWDLQCKFATLVRQYADHLNYGIHTNSGIDCLKTFKNGLQLLNRYDPRDIAGDTTDYNTLTYSTILNILQTLYKKY
jgi:hypothetical protein